jgi:PAS domain S-box-containing protein
MKSLFSPKSIVNHNAALRVALIYAGFSLLWIFFSDQIALYLAKDAEILTRIQRLKDWAFVIVTAFIVYVLLLREIIKVKQAEEALREGMQNYQGIFNATSEAILIHNAENGKIVDVNQPMLDMFGFSYEDALQLTINDLSSGEPPYSQQEALDLVRKAIDHGPQLFECAPEKKAGSALGQRSR